MIESDNHDRCHELNGKRKFSSTNDTSIDDDNVACSPSGADDPGDQHDAKVQCTITNNIPAQSTTVCVPNMRKDLGRSEYFRLNVDKRERIRLAQKERVQTVDAENVKTPVQYAGIPQFSNEEIAAECRRPKRKVAVLFGYSGHGYKGLQIMPDQRTIEGDLFAAFVSAGAISKANANDPKKSSLVRCARTDKGVHAVGNVVSLKLILEDPDIVEKINSHLPKQIRVWHVMRTLGGFSAYQACDSRWYEYLIPSYCFLPPKPNSVVGRLIQQTLINDVAAKQRHRERLADLWDFWVQVEQREIDPVLSTLDSTTYESVMNILNYEKGSNNTHSNGCNSVLNGNESLDQYSSEGEDSDTNNNGNVMGIDGLGSNPISERHSQLANQGVDQNANAKVNAAIRLIREAVYKAQCAYRISDERISYIQSVLDQFVGTHGFHNYTVRKKFDNSSAKRHIKSFRVLRQYAWSTKGDEVETTSANASDPSNVTSTTHCEEKLDNFDETGVSKDGTEWISLQIHGQSFMMHQIRKMVFMTAQIVRMGVDFKRIINASFGPPERIDPITAICDGSLSTSLEKSTVLPNCENPSVEATSKMATGCIRGAQLRIFTIPKAPALGLLLLRPVFDSYNKRRLKPQHAIGITKDFPDAIDFTDCSGKMREFAIREIYSQIFTENEREKTFLNFFAHVDGGAGNGFTRSGVEDGWLYWFLNKGYTGDK